MEYIQGKWCLSSIGASRTCKFWGDCAGSQLRGSGYLGYVDSKQSEKKPNMWVKNVRKSEGYFNLHKKTGYIQYPEPLRMKIRFLIKQNKCSSDSRNHC